MAKSPLARMGMVAAECIMEPRRISYWIEAEGRYICPKEDNALAEAGGQVAQTVIPKSERLDPKFKLVFLALVVGTFLFTSLCVGLVWTATGDLPPMRHEVVETILTMAKVGFGAIGGLLAGKSV